MRGLIQWPPEESIPLPAVDLIDNNLTNELILANLGQDLGPNDPVDTAREDDSETDDTVDPVGKIVVDVLALLRGNKGSNSEVDVAEHEEEDDGETGADGRVPVPGLAVEVEMDETAGDEGVDDSEGIRDETRDRSAVVLR